MKYYPILDFFLSIFGLNSHFRLIIKNKTKEDVKVSLFGVNEFMDKPNFGLPKGIEVRVRWWGYKRLLDRIKKHPFKIAGFTIKCKCAPQLEDKVISIESADVRTGDNVMLPIFPRNYVSPHQEEGNYAAVHSLSVKLDEMVKVHLTLLPREKVEIFFAKDK